MWEKGKWDAYGGTVEYWAKVYDEPSEFGINGGRISKLTLKCNGKTILNYDRGWDVKPQTKSAKIVLEALLQKYAVKKA